MKMSDNEEAAPAAAPAGAPGEEQSKVAMEPKKRRRSSGSLQRMRKRSRRNGPIDNPVEEGPIDNPVEEPLVDDDDVAEAAERLFDNGVDQFILDRLGRKRYSSDALRSRRMAIHYFYTQFHGSAPETSGAWKGKEGIVAQIRDQVLLPKKSSQLKSTRDTMRVISEFQANDRVY
jgi:hypothetical protein